MRCVQPGGTTGRGSVKGLLVVPCKTMISGEYGVLEAGGSALALAEGTGLRVRVEGGDRLEVVFAELGLEASFRAGELERSHEPEPGLGRCFWWSAKVVQAALADPELRKMVVPDGAAGDELGAAGVQGGSYLMGSSGGELCGVRLVYEVVGGPGAMPVGSSAAFVVGAVRGISQRMGVELADGAVYRLAASAHALSQRGGSGYDVAASAYGDWVYYQRDPMGALPWEGWEAESCRDHGVLAETLHFAWRYGSWPRIRYRKRLGLGVVAADTGVRARTTKYLEAYERQRCRERIRGVMMAHQRASNALAKALWGGAPASNVRELVRDSVASLRALDGEGGLGVYTPEIDALLFEAARGGVAAKVSGAGGGDYVVALVWGREEYERCLEAWYRTGFNVLPLLRPAG